jgi:hypothetical protein
MREAVFDGGTRGHGGCRMNVLVSSLTVLTGFFTLLPEPINSEERR